MPLGPVPLGPLLLLLLLLSLLCAGRRRTRAASANASMEACSTVWEGSSPEGSANSAREAKKTVTAGRRAAAAGPVVGMMTLPLRETGLLEPDDGFC